MIQFISFNRARLYSVIFPQIKISLLEKGDVDFDDIVKFLSIANNFKI